MRSAQVSEQLIGWVIMLLIVPLFILHKKFVYKIEKKQSLYFPMLVTNIDISFDNLCQILEKF